MKTRPRGVVADHPRLDLMRREYLTMTRTYAPEAATEAAIRKDFRKLVPLLEWVRHNASAPIDD